MGDMKRKKPIIRTKPFETIYILTKLCSCYARATNFTQMNLKLTFTFKICFKNQNKYK